MDAETQFELDFTRQTGPAGLSDDAQQLLGVLRGRGWRLARDLRAETGLTDRALRQAASESDGAIISGQLGYRLTDEATTSEIATAANFLASQARAMLARSVAIRRRAHKKVSET